MATYTKPAGSSATKNAGFICNPYSWSDKPWGATGTNSGASDKSNPNPYSLTQKGKL